MTNKTKNKRSKKNKHNATKKLLEYMKTVGGAKTKNKRGQDVAATASSPKKIVKNKGPSSLDKMKQKQVAAALDKQTMVPPIVPSETIPEASLNTTPVLDTAAADAAEQERIAADAAEQERIAAAAADAAEQERIASSAAAAAEQERTAAAAEQERIASSTAAAAEQERTAAAAEQERTAAAATAAATAAAAEQERTAAAATAAATASAAAEQERTAAAATAAAAAAVASSEVPLAPLLLQNDALIKGDNAESSTLPKVPVVDTLQNASADAPAPPETNATKKKINYLVEKTKKVLEELLAIEEKENEKEKEKETETLMFPQVPLQLPIQTQEQAGEKQQQVGSVAAASRVPPENLDASSPSVTAASSVLPENLGAPSVTAASSTVLPENLDASSLAAASRVPLENPEASSLADSSTPLLVDNNIDASSVTTAPAQLPGGEKGTGTAKQVIGGKKNLKRKKTHYKKFNSNSSLKRKHKTNKITDTT